MQDLVIGYIDDQGDIMYTPGFIDDNNVIHPIRTVLHQIIFEDELDAWSWLAEYGPCGERIA